MTTDSDSDRRTLLKASGVLLATGGLAGCLGGGRGGRDGSGTTTTDTATTHAGNTGTATAHEENDHEETTADDHITEQGSGTESETETATALYLPIEVGLDGRLVFSPSGDEPLVVEPGTEVGFRWRSDNHNVVVDDQPNEADWQGTPGGPETFYDEGYEDSHTFEITGTYEFHCEAHEPAGMTGTIVVREDVPTPTFATEADLPVRVGPSGEFVFSPGTDRPLKVSAGTEVRFVWESDSHNIVMDDQPPTAEWYGSPDTPSVTYDAGYEFSHTFDVPGVYEFHCEPHETLGMEGTIVVTEE